MTIVFVPSCEVIQSWFDLISNGCKGISGFKRKVVKSFDHFTYFDRINVRVDNEGKCTYDLAIEFLLDHFVQVHSFQTAEESLLRENVDHPICQAFGCPVHRSVRHQCNRSKIVTGTRPKVGVFGVANRNVLAENVSTLDKIYLVKHIALFQQNIAHFEFLLKHARGQFAYQMIRQVLKQICSLKKASGLFVVRKNKRGLDPPEAFLRDPVELTIGFGQYGCCTRAIIEKCQFSDHRSLSGTSLVLSVDQKADGSVLHNVQIISGVTLRNYGFSLFCAVFLHGIHQSLHLVGVQV
mmetsp:Transcript_8398/g.24821  ORF Transcript_8398/g.24821 Transcript_8398/m.24821 type:complete len:295 (-) Transcript_8398:631-1515(-)